jgi:hypothetical protein
MHRNYKQEDEICGHVVRMREMINAYKSSAGKPGTDHLRDTGTHGRIILNWLKK